MRIDAYLSDEPQGAALFLPRANLSPEDPSSRSSLLPKLSSFPQAKISPALLSSVAKISPSQNISNGQPRAKPAAASLPPLHSKSIPLNRKKIPSKYLSADRKSTPLLRSSQLPNILLIPFFQVSISDWPSKTLF